MRVLRIAVLLGSFSIPTPGLAQINTVPMQGLGNEWVKQLQLRGTMEWEWIETYPDRVFFATRRAAHRDGDMVTMWMRIEYKDTQSPSSHRSALSRDDWDCTQKRRANVATFFFRWNNLDDDDPERATAMLRNWEKIEPGTLADTLLQFACSIRPVQQLVDPGKPEAPR